MSLYDTGMHVKPLAKAQASLRPVLLMGEHTMHDAKFRQAFGDRLKKLRKDKKWTQKELAQKIGVRFEQLNKYEMGLNAPPLEKLLALAEALSLTTDFLLTGVVPKDQPLVNTRLLTRFEALQDFAPEAQETVIHVIDAMIVQHRVTGAVIPVDRPPKRASGG